MTAEQANATAIARDPLLREQTVVLIGGSAGIGLETARLARAEGAEVVLGRPESERLSQAAREVGARSTAVLDATDPVSARAVLRRPAGTDRSRPGHRRRSSYGPLLEMEADAVRDALSDHVVLGLEVARHAAPRMRPGGTLLLMGGTGGRRVGRGLGIVSAATAALPPFTAALALELAPVRVNLIAAGFVDTPLSASLLGDDLEARRDGAPHDAPDRTRRRARGRGGARRSHHEQHRADGRDVRHRRRPAVRLVTSTRSREPIAMESPPRTPANEPAGRDHHGRVAGDRRGPRHRLP